MTPNSVTCLNSPKPRPDISDNIPHSLHKSELLFKSINMKGVKEECQVCKAHVEENEKGICCEICEYWYHSKCMKLNDATYKFFEKENQPWACSSCIKSKKEDNELRNLIMKMVEEKEEDREERALMMSMMNKMCDRISGLEKILEAKMNEKIKTSEKVILLKVNQDMEERFEKFKRRKNVVIYGMPEREDGTSNENERLEADNANIKKLLREINVNVKNFEASRIGKKTLRNIPRPMRVEFSKESERYETLKKAASLRFTKKAELKKVIVSADMSFKERESQKLLREELKERRQAGEINIKIRKGRIVKEGVDGGE